ncbi:MAG TPA: ABC transporter ATP-binding protein [Chloroflexi bacterium]|nr:ABC transporter ATP-binding protein [Chloroflexota bacterium]
MRNPLRAISESGEDRARNRGAVLRRLLVELKPYKGVIALAVVMMALSGAAQGLSPLITGQIVDKVLLTGDLPALTRMALLLVLAYLVNMVATRFQIYLVSRTGQQILAKLRNEVFAKVESLSLKYLESKQAGDLMSRLINDIDALNNFFTQVLSQFIGAAFTLGGILVAMLLLSWQLGLAVLMVVPILLVVTNVFSRMARRAFRQTRETLGDVSANLEEELGGVRVAQAFNRTQENVRRFARSNAANRDANVSATAITSAFTPAVDLLSTLDMALVAALGGFLVIRGVISVGTVVAFIQYVQSFFRPFQTVTQLWTIAQSAFAAAERVFDLLDMEATVEDKPDAVEMGRIEGHVRFEEVDFSYEEGQPVLEKVSFEALPGQTIALVGPTGAGKTTMVSLIARFYDPTSGRVLIDGKDLRDVRQLSLRSQMGLVTQEPFLFSGSVMDNIRYGHLDASDEEVMAAAHAANAEEFILRLPEGYQTEVGQRGSLLSQGQRQLISIARAVLADPRILILDEATASIDTRTEVLIQKALGQLLKGRTSFVIAHRLSTVRNADQVLVIDQSRIVERGTHEELIQKNGLYAELYRRQFYQPEEESAPAAPAVSS